MKALTRPGIGNSAVNGLDSHHNVHRLDDGKVYVPDQARRALRNFFRQENLVALRELALKQRCLSPGVSWLRGEVQGDGFGDFDALRQGLYQLKFATLDISQNPGGHSCVVDRVLEAIIGCRPAVV